MVGGEDDGVVRERVRWEPGGHEHWVVAGTGDLERRLVSERGWEESGDGASDGDEGRQRVECIARLGGEGVLDRRGREYYLG